MKYSPKSGLLNIFFGLENQNLKKLTVLTIPGHRETNYKR